jgi:hypothetical protein
LCVRVRAPTCGRACIFARALRIDQGPTPAASRIRWTTETKPSYLLLLLQQQEARAACCLLLLLLLLEQ